jgi:uncharacterized protein (TIGR03435 family)
MGICVSSRTSSQFSSLSRYWTIQPNQAEPGPAVPVLDRTELPGVYDLTVGVKPELGMDSFTLWQRAPRKQMGLRIESRRGPVEIVVVDDAVRRRRSCLTPEKSEDPKLPADEVR